MMLGRVIPQALLLILASIILKASCKGDSSLTFLIDDTGSMTDDIAGVRRSVKRISDMVFTEKSSLISNMVLVTFNDPDAQVRVVTNNRYTFERTLGAVYAHNIHNPDCWEPSMNGLRLALEKSNSNSFIYVFTDAPAKDYRDSHYITDLCQKKQTQVTFVLTGRCSDWYHPKAFDVYYEIAQACSGLAFDVSKTNVEEVLKILEETIKGNKTVITAQIIPAGVQKNIPFTIDGHTDYAIVSVSGKNVYLDISGPSADLRRIMWNDNGKVVKLSNAKPGNYVATVKGYSRTSVIVVGRTDFFFTHGFSKLKPKSLGDTALQPIADENVHLSISVTDDHHTVNIQSAQILDIHENPMKAPMPLTEISKDFYVTSPFVAPSEIFKVVVHGIVKATGKPIKRIVKIPITPQPKPIELPKNTKPTVEIAEGRNLEIEYNSTTQLTCKVVAYPAPKIQWINHIGHRMPSKMSLVESPYKYISYMDLTNALQGDRYKCYAVNELGRAENTVNVVVKEPFNVIAHPPGQIKVTYGKEATITCDVTSRLPMDIQWYHTDEKTGRRKEITNFAKYELSASRTQLKIKRMDLDLVGQYSCRFSLKNKKDMQKIITTQVIIDGLIPPKLQGATEIKVTKGKTAVLECKVVSGLPAPEIKWEFGGKTGATFTRYSRESVLRITNVMEKDEGKYKCLAENVAGKDEHVITLFVQELPKISTGSTVVYQAIEGDALLKIPCVAAGIPKPDIIWKLNGHNIIPSAKYSMEDGTLIIRDPKVIDTNSYTCEAKNDAGVVSATFKTYIRQPPKLSGVTSKSVRLGTATSIECNVVKGEPKPKITWLFEDKSTLKYVSIVGSETTLRIPIAEKKHTGNYKCVADNFIGKDEHVTALTVEYAPEIIKSNSSTIIEGIEGDLALRIPCNITGVPQPVVTWKTKGVAITPSSKYSIEDGALVIKNPTTKDTSSYTCEAKNHISTVSATLKVEVDKLPKNFGTEHNVYLLHGETRKLNCEAFKSKSQSVKWFITKEVRDWSSTTTSSPHEGVTVAPSTTEHPSTRRTITEDAGNKEPYLQIADASSFKHDGNYTCHVSDKNGNTQTHTYIVDVGFAPTFVSEATDITSWYGEINNIKENCDVNSKPEAIVEWKFNGKELTDLNMGGLGQYVCNVTNVHGSIQKKFVVKTSVCLISRNLANAQYMPLILTDKFWHKLEYTTHYMVVEPEEKITLTCPSQTTTPNAFKKLPKKSTIEAICYKEDSFSVEGEIRKFSDLQCTNIIQPAVIRKKVKCSTETSELMRVGYNIPEFLEAYEVCFDHEKHMPLYTRLIMTATNINGLSPGYSWYTYPGIDSTTTNRGFTCKDPSSSCCYSKSQLVNAADFNDGPAKKSTFIDPLNAIPVWIPCNSSRPSWEDINKMARKPLVTYTDSIVWSGTHTLQEKYGAIIPRYLWKVIGLGDEVVVIVHVNDPKPVKEDIKCKSQYICEDNIDYKDWFSFKGDKYTYCCSLPDFLKSFNISSTSIGEPIDTVLDKITIV